MYKFNIMGVIGYIHRTVKPKDHRRAEGGYYHAQCDECGGEFYPLRENAKFCSRYCSGRYYHRKYRHEGRYKYKGGGDTKEATIEVKKEVSKNSQSPKRVIRTATATYKFLLAKYPEIDRQKGKWVRSLKGMEIGGNIRHGSHRIERISEQKWQVRRRLL